MSFAHQKQEKKLVPRFRRKNAKTFIDADEQEAQALIAKDLQSYFKWTSDTNQECEYKFDDNQSEGNHQNISINDQTGAETIFDLGDRSEPLWKQNVEKEGPQPVRWSHDQQSRQISFSIFSGHDLRPPEWTLLDDEQHVVRLTLTGQNDEHCRHDLHTENDRPANCFVRDDSFGNEIEFDTGSSGQTVNLFVSDENDKEPGDIDADLPSFEPTLSLPQSSVVAHWLEGISQYNLSITEEYRMPPRYSPLTDIKIQLDSVNLKSATWSLDILRENLIVSYLISLPDTRRIDYSMPDSFHLKLSADDQSCQQLFSLIDFSFRQTLSLSADDIRLQLLSIIDSYQPEQSFGSDTGDQQSQWSLQDLKAIVQNISPSEMLEYIYSPMDVKEISFEQLVIASDEISARAFRRYRCKHVSIKPDENGRMDCEDGVNLLFKGNETAAVGEPHIDHDLKQEQVYSDLTKCRILLESQFSRSYDVAESSPTASHVGPCLYRLDYERPPPPTWPQLRREIGFISYDASLAQPVYYFNKSFKRFVHPPKQRDKCSYDVRHGYEEFLEMMRNNPDTYFRRFDSTDLRPLLCWYQNKQYLFSSTSTSMLKPPTFICRRLVLRTIMANLYCDSEPWKLLVVRIRGQFYLALANRATKSLQEMTPSEYSGYKFEALFTTEQPNTTRFQDKIPLEKPQRQFHTVRYWQFGEFNLLYSSEIDGELMSNDEESPKETTIPVDKKEDDTTAAATHELPTETTRCPQEPVPLAKDPCESANHEAVEMQINDERRSTETAEQEKKESVPQARNELQPGYVEMKCTNRKIFYRDENKLHTLHWWAQMWLANVDTLMVGYRDGDDKLVDQIELLSTSRLVHRFLARYDLRLAYCLSYLHSFLELVQRTVLIDDPNTVHTFAYIPPPLAVDPLSGKMLQVDLPEYVPFQHGLVKRSNARHSNFMPQAFVDEMQRSFPLGGASAAAQPRTVEQEMKKRISHRGRASCILQRDKTTKKRA